MFKGQHFQKINLYKTATLNCFKKKIYTYIYIVLVSVSLMKKQIYNKCIISGDI